METLYYILGALCFYVAGYFSWKPIQILRHIVFEITIKGDEDESEQNKRDNSKSGS